MGLFCIDTSTSLKSDCGSKLTGPTTSASVKAFSPLVIFSLT